MRGMAYVVAEEPILKREREIGIERGREHDIVVYIYIYVYFYL